MDNALNCCEIISELTRTHCLDHIFLVTNEFHMPRAHILFKSALKRRQNPQLHPVPAENGLAAGNEYRYRVFYYSKFPTYHFHAYEHKITQSYR